MNQVLLQADVTDSYIRKSPEHLRACVERVASFLSARFWPRRRGSAPSRAPRSDRWRARLDSNQGPSA